MITLEEKLKQFTPEEREQIYARAEEMKKEVLILKAVRVEETAVPSLTLP
ncbi:MAG: hypothetical protein F6K41_41460 [Symploca sp. SIO3E6]|nr:hypothetical protein [Caldora sp. SIO3E6]